MRYQRSLWLGLLCFGGLSTLCALACFIALFVKGPWSWIPGTVLLLGAFGGGILIFYARRCLKLLPEIQKQLNAKANKERKQAEESLARSLPVVHQSFSRCLSTFILLLAAAVFLWAYTKAHDDGIVKINAASTGGSERATVVAVNQEEYRGDQNQEDRPVGKQYVTVEIAAGTFKGQQYSLVNDLSVWYGTVLKEGDDVIVGFSLEDGKISGDMVISDYDRTQPLLIVLGLFILITVLVGGKIGLKSLFGLLLTFVCLFTVAIPLLLSGWPTVPTILGMCAFVTVVEFVVLDGANKKTFCAIFGTLSGVALAAVFASVSEGLLRVNGYHMQTVDNMIEELGNHKMWQQMINGSTFKSLQISDLLIGGILIAALGAVNDVAMSISSAMRELVVVNPELTRKELFKSGMNIGRDMVGTMTNTLILAVAGSSLVAMIFYTVLKPSWNMMIDSSMLPIEILQALASSAGVVLAVPLTVIIGTFVYGHAHQKPESIAKK